MASYQPPTLLTEALPQIQTFIKPASTSDALALSAVILGCVSYLLDGIVWNKPNPHVTQFFRRPQLAEGASAVNKRESRNVAKKIEDHNKDVVIFWGSQSGTAEQIANRLGRELHLRFGLAILVADLSDYDAETIALIPATKLAIFVMSTYGEGDPSDNTFGFWEWIHKTEGVSLSLRYAAFGLGNSNYKHYNRVIDFSADALNRFGAQIIMPVGKADDAAGGTEEDFMTWKERLFEVLQGLGMKENEAVYMPTFEVVEDSSLMPIDLHDGEPTHLASAKTCSTIRALKVLKTKELFSSKERNCLHMDLDLSEDPDLHYKTGDHLAVWPMNPEEEVRLLLDTLQLGDVHITIKSLDPTVKIRIPTPTTISALCRNYLEICAPVSREVILGLAYFAPTEEAKNFLRTLGKDKLTFNDFLDQHYLTIGRVLALACPNSSWNIPLSFLIESLPHLQPRYYSISSSSIVSPRQPSITALVAKTPLPSGETVLGVTSNFLLSLSKSETHAYQFAGPSQKLEDGRIFAHIRKSKFKLPVQASSTLIMIAAGTGLAPFMAFLSEKRKLMDIGKPVGQMMLFYGCRDSNDFIYREELEDFVKAFDGKLALVTAFSRMGPRVYVQDRVSERYDDVMGMISEGANVYICGRANMAKDVERVLGETTKMKNGWNEGQLNEWSRKLKGMRKWQEDVWG